jgi:hypothetical protein
MIDAAVDELAGIDDVEAEKVVEELMVVAHFPDEHSAEEAGLEVTEQGYATWLMDDNPFFQYIP